MTRREFSKLGLAAAMTSALPSFGEPGSRAECRLKIGIISDVHVRTMADAVHLRKAFSWFDRQQADGVVIAGDFGFDGLISEMKVVADVWKELFPNDQRSDGGHIEKLFVTGNHDEDGYFYHQKDFPKVRFPADPETAKESFVFNRRRVWRELFGEEYEAVKMKTVKGYRFVLHQWYPRLTSDVCASRWLQPPPDEPIYHELRHGVQALPRFFSEHGAELKGTRPFFFVQHHAPGGTLYSPYAYSSPEGWGAHDNGLATRFLQDYPNCVAFSGHTHMSPVFEQSIWQGAFTAVDAGACPGAAMAGSAIGARANASWGRADGKGTALDVATPKVGQLMRVYDDRIVIENREFSTGLALTEPREFPWPIYRGKPYAYATRRAAAVVPEFPADAKLVRIETDDEISVAFPTVRRENAGVRAIDYEVTCTGSAGYFRRIVDQRRVYSQGLALPEQHDRESVTVVYAKAELAKSGLTDFRFEVRPCDSWDQKGRALEG
ncbi:MAG: metallophosphoesterase [Kiritimatiellia bacterium]